MGDADVLEAELLPETGELAPTLEYAGSVSLLESEGIRRPLKAPSESIAKPLAALGVGGVATLGLLAGVPALAVMPLFVLAGGLFVAFAGGAAEASILLAEPIRENGRLVGWTIKLSDLEGRAPPERTAVVPLHGPARAVDLSLHASPGLSLAALTGGQQARLTIAIDRVNGGVATIYADTGESAADLVGIEASLRRLLRLPIR